MAILSRAFDGLLYLLLVVFSHHVSPVSGTAVFAHIVAGNSGSYSAQNWLSDCTLAKSVGFDGFIMDIAPNTYNLEPMLNLAYAAAAQVGHFYIWLSFDYIGGSSAWNAAQVISLINAYSSMAAQYKWTNGQPAVTTFEGCDNLNDWTNIQAQTNCFFIPNYSCLGPFDAVNQPAVNGLAAWDDAAWPVGPNNITEAGDQNYLNALGGKPYMMPVSPWFFRNVYGDNWLWRGDDLWFDRWNQAANIKPAIIQVVSWNDYGESHYVGPLPPAGANAIPAGDTYTAGHPHDAWLADLPYFIAKVKGTKAPLTPEHITIWYRLNPSTSGSTGGTMCNPPNRGLTLYPPAQCSQDIISVNVLAASSGTVVADIGGHVLLKSNVEAGMSHFSIPFTGWPGIPTVSLQRKGKNITTVHGAVIQAPANGVVNWNAYVAGSTTAPGS